ncbi:MAG: hypothetical protein HZA89_09680 [Verrucomicrobia bacterium]|nr:hypothetical protein [Verrucomicrobiota bacterium]
MKPYKVIKGQIVSGTREDSQGERRSKEFLEKLASPPNKRVPLSQHHDMSKETIGYLENFRVEADPNQAGEWFLKADVFFTTDSIDEALKGFSYSLTEVFTGNRVNPIGELHLPFPFYNDKELIKEFLSTEPAVAIGKWHKKAADGGTTALIIAVATFMLKPAWETVYKELVEPHVKKLGELIPKLKSKGLSPHFVQVLRRPTGEKFGVYFIPQHGKEEFCLSPEKIKAGIGELDRFSKSDPKVSAVGIHTARMLFDSKLQQYRIIHIQYGDGTDVNLVHEP